MFAVLVMASCAMTTSARAEDGSSRAATTAGVTVYQAKLKPLLKARCFSCHGALRQEAGLRLDTVELMRRGGDSGPAIEADEPLESLILKRVAAQDVNDRMPPEFEGEAFAANELSTLREWLEVGAPGPANEVPEADPRNHWAFRPIRRPALPDAISSDWIRNPIDAFVAEAHHRHGLTPARVADRTTLLRRVSLDLLGVPPTPAEIDAARNAVADEWYEAAVARMLDDPRHGERWARHWMDIWRYSDWWGLGQQLRNSQKHIWHWRDWIIESLNDDTPYDEMLRLMLAADELHPGDLNRLRATGFLARNYFLFNRNQWMDETVEHTSKAFLGLTMNCAKCHDHKYDPVTQVDYYRMRAIFEPYHVRLDVSPGATSLDRDGIPVVFDGLPELETFRFIRGQESQPDRSQNVLPGIPEPLAFAPLTVARVELPAEAWQPARRPWVIRDQVHQARQELAKAESAIEVARRKLREAEAVPLPEPAVDTDSDSTAEQLPASLTAKQLEFLLAEMTLLTARAQQTSLAARGTASRAVWEQTDSGGDQAPASIRQSAEAAARAAARSERELSVAQARMALARARLNRHLAHSDKQDTAAKAVDAARESLADALEKLEKPGDEFTPFEGARWTATRFFNSGKDDPAVPFPSYSTGRRKALAEWITDQRNPLTARVAVNHVWTRHFGSPLVSSVFDFGRNGQPPTHPELLDWLAVELIESGWSLKHLHRLIVSSATYRMASTHSMANSQSTIDPDNRLLWKRQPQRLESQAVRDSILSLAGTLSPQMGGPPVLAAAQATSTRRSLYFFHSNNDRNLFLTMFDEALVKDCYVREQSVVPQQALAMANSRLVLDSAPRIARELTGYLHTQPDREPTVEEFINAAFRCLLGFEPSVAERSAAIAAIRDWQQQVSNGDAVEFARTQLVWVLLNHNDFVTVR